jgi:fermentation-respiration switch protein FrsA (DUF1100 family)
MARQDIEFSADGATLRGWLYQPDSGTGPYPTVILQHGFAAVIQMYLDDDAETFCEAGLDRDSDRGGVEVVRERHVASPAVQERGDLRSFEFFRGFDPASFLPRISPTRMLMIVAPGDQLAYGPTTLAAYETAVPPKSCASSRAATSTLTSPRRRPCPPRHCPARLGRRPAGPSSGGAAICSARARTR